ncbi:hypothetical protein D3C77_532530 [compost metagenome]
MATLTSLNNRLDRVSPSNQAFMEGSARQATPMALMRRTVTSSSTRQWRKSTSSVMLTGTTV